MKVRHAIHSVNTLLLLIGLLQANAAMAITEAQVVVKAGDNAALIRAITAANSFPDESTVIVIAPGADGEKGFLFDQAFEGENALPPITGNVTIKPRDSSEPVVFRGAGSALSMRLFEVTGSGRLEIADASIEQFHVNGNGGAILAGDNSKLFVDRVEFAGNAAGGEGGAILAMGNASVASDRCGFSGNSAGNVGGAISVAQASLALVKNCVFASNNADVFGADINVNSSGQNIFTQGRIALGAFSNTFSGTSSTVRIEDPAGPVYLQSNTFHGDNDAIDSTDDVTLTGNLVASGSGASAQKFMAGMGGSATIAAVCNDFGTSAFSSLGYNLSYDSSCALTHPTDQPNTDALVEAPDSNGVVALKSNSPAIDSGAADLIDIGGGQRVLPCGYRDARGLGRPQDANGDGVIECDIGSYEVQGGADIGAPQSAAFYDTARSGEGVFVEVLPGGQTFATMFSYAMDGSGPVWFAGLGNVVGNSMVIDEMQQPIGGVFGTGFNADNIVRETVGSMSLSFPTCEASSRSGKLAFQAALNGGFEDLLVDASRLTTIVPCTGSAPSNSGRSGSFYDPSRSGEGIIVQWLDDGQVVVIWYTFDPQGNQFWAISDGATVSGNAITAAMVYPSTPTKFGQSFDANQIVLSPWGTTTVTYQPGCSNVSFSYISTVDGFGTGSYEYSRLTTLAGTSCDL